MSNYRNAGRKKKFDEKDIEKILEMMKSGYTIMQISKELKCSRQVISRYLNNKNEKNNYVLRIYYMCKNKISTIIDVDFLNEKVKIQNRTDDVLDRAFGVITNPTFKQFEKFIESRCVPQDRPNIMKLLNDMGIDTYDPMQIVRKTNGKLSGDYYYLKFSSLV